MVEPALDRQWRLAALLHDAPEYVIGDMISPFKAALGLDYRAFENRLLGGHPRAFRPAAEVPAADRPHRQAGRQGRGLSRGDPACRLQPRGGGALLRPAAESGGPAGQPPDKTDAHAGGWRRASAIWRASGRWCREFPQ